MNLRPIIERELRVSARQATTQYFRCAFAALVVGLFVLLFGGSHIASGNFAQSGRELFSIVCPTLFTLIWIVIPISMADVISREKREDTLGLLQLTPLRPYDVVMSKIIGGLIRGIYLLLAGVPVLAMSILLGGVTFMDLVRVVILDLSALICATTAGVVTSAVSERRGRAWFASVLVGFAWFVAVFFVHYMILVLTFNPTGWMEILWDSLLDRRVDAMVMIWTVSAGNLIFWGATPYLGSPATVGAAALTLLLSIITARLGAGFAARRVRLYVQNPGRSVRGEKVARALTRDRFIAGWGKNRLRQLIERNPSAWLQQRKWTARLAKWGWSLLTVCFITLVMATSGGSLDSIIAGCSLIWAIVSLSLLLICATGFQQERDSGALELLLVTELTPTQIIRGRISGIRWSFIPCGIFSLCLFVYVAQYNMRLSYVYQTYYGSSNLTEELIVLGSLVGGFGALVACLPDIGLCFSLNRRGALASIGCTLLFAVALPWLLPVAVFGAGLFLYGIVHGNYGPNFNYELYLFGGMVALAGAQVVLLMALLRGKLAGFPRLVPAVVSRRGVKMLWALPWIAPVLAYVWWEIFMPITMQTSDGGLIVFFGWQVVAWILLGFFAIRSRRELLRMIEKRTFLGDA